MEIESFGYTMSDLRFAWGTGMESVQMDSKVSLPQFNVLGHKYVTYHLSPVTCHLSPVTPGIPTTAYKR